MKKDTNIIIIAPNMWNKLTIDTLLKNYWKAPRKMVHEWRMSKKVTVNGEVANWTKSLHEGDELSLPIFENLLPLPTPQDLSISILYEDDTLLIANKPAGVETHPSEVGQTHTLLNGVAYHLKQTGQTCMIRHIHRLDKDTTGAVLFAKNQFVGALLDKMLEQRKITRSYYALVEGLLSQNNGTINEKIGRDRHHATRRRVSTNGQTAITHYRVLKRYKNMTLVSCILESGRTHQIRVHFSHINHPLAGDLLYGGKPVFPRQALHAQTIEFVHPLTEEKISCYAPFLDNPPIFEIK
jgi:23S rRNA pseudouridine1911/1915/1917 synthase